MRRCTRPLPGAWHPVGIQQTATLRVLLFITDIPIKRTGKLRVSEGLGFPPRSMGPHRVGHDRSDLAAAAAAKGEAHFFPLRALLFPSKLSRSCTPAEIPAQVIKPQICSLGARNTSLALSPETLAFLPWRVSLHPDLNEPEVAEQCLVNMCKGGGWGSLSQCPPHPQEINTANAAIQSAVSLDSVARGPAVYFPPNLSSSLRPSRLPTPAAPGGSQYDCGPPWSRDPGGRAGGGRAGGPSAFSQLMWRS